MKLDLVFGLFALIPASLNPVPSASPTWVDFCGSDGVTHHIAINLPQREPPGGAMAMCCAKGCHTGRRRRRENGDPSPGIDPAQ